MADDPVADDPVPDDLTRGVRICLENLTKFTDKWSDAIKVKDELQWAGQEQKKLPRRACLKLS